LLDVIKLDAGNVYAMVLLMAVMTIMTTIAMVAVVAMVAAVRDVVAVFQLVDGCMLRVFCNDDYHHGNGQDHHGYGLGFSLH